jgi:adenine-specific DNA-methyltransferase
MLNPLPGELFSHLRNPEDLAKYSSSSPETEDLYLRRRGQQSGYRHQRPNQFYAIMVDEASSTVVGVGPLLGPSDDWMAKSEDGIAYVYPLDTRGDERVWRYSRETMQSYIERGEIVVTGKSAKTPQVWVLNHRVKRESPPKRVKTVWWERRHDAGAHGSDLVTALLGRSGRFLFQSPCTPLETRSI